MDDELCKDISALWSKLEALVPKSFNYTVLVTESVSVTDDTTAVTTVGGNPLFN